MTIPLKQVIQAIEEASEVFTSFWDTKTGGTVYLADPLMIDMTEEDKILAVVIESAFSRKNTGGTCLRHPWKGAFRRFKQSVHYHGLELR